MKGKGDRNETQEPFISRKGKEKPKLYTQKRQPFSNHSPHNLQDVKYLASFLLFPNTH
jgi:hypothetical protein